MKEKGVSDLFALHKVGNKNKFNRQVYAIIFLNEKISSDKLAFIEQCAMNTLKLAPSIQEQLLI